MRTKLVFEHLKIECQSLQIFKVQESVFCNCRNYFLECVVNKISPNINHITIINCKITYEIVLFAFEYFTKSVHN